jgi:GDPmannose 4,6-dehydratase
MTALSLIIGSSGQDGQILAESLAKKGWAVVCCSRDLISGPGFAEMRPRLHDPAWVADLISRLHPVHIYYLAALHHSSEECVSNDGAIFTSMMAVNTQGLVNVLEAIRIYSPQTRLFYASSSHVFGRPFIYPQDEETPVQPITLYGITKAAAMFACNYYRQAHDVFAVSGILYNHESALRSPKFLSAKITRAVAEIKAGTRSDLILGNLDAVADWGYAPDYVEAMQAMLELSFPEDFVIATGIGHTVREFADIAFSSADLDYRDYVRSESTLLVRNQGALIGNPHRLKRATGWSATINFDEMVKQLVACQLKS